MCLSYTGPPRPMSCSVPEIAALLHLCRRPTDLPWLFADNTKGEGNCATS